MMIHLFIFDNALAILQPINPPDGAPDDPNDPQD